MKSKLTYLLATLFLCLWAVCANAQTTTPNGKAQLIEFTNATAKFTVPAGKTWVVNNVFSSSEIEKDVTNQIILKKINNTDYGSNGPIPVNPQSEPKKIYKKYILGIDRNRSLQRFLCLAN
jgi:hypothetical protein